VNKCIFALACAAAFVPASLGAQRSAAGPDDPALRGWLTERIADRPGVGLVVGIYAGGHTRVVAAGTGGPHLAQLNGDTVFEIGSATKVFTAALLADMVARGEVGLEDSIRRFLPADVRPPTRGGAEIRLVDLATHTAGLPRMPANLAPDDAEQPYADYTTAMMYQFLSSYGLPRDIGERYEYSNFGFGLLGDLLARRNGTAYGRLVTDRVLRPLRMTDTGIGLTPTLTRRAAIGHSRQGNAAPNWTFAALAGCGALRSTANDLLKFVAANLAPPSDALRRALLSMHAPRHALSTPDGDIGLAWHVRRAFGDEFVWHNGETGGFHSFIGLNHRSGLGVVVLHNSAEGIEDIGFHVLDERFPLAPPQARKPRLAIDLPAGVLDSYAGTYELPGSSLVVTRENQSLFVRPTGQSKVRAYAETPTGFFFGAIDAQITFLKDAEGRVTGMTLHQGGRDTQARRIISGQGQ
jgi:serine-type D-Ala-D-Ala carboxypeptidase/endopeptidase